MPLRVRAMPWAALLLVLAGCGLDTVKPGDGYVLPAVGESAIAWASDAAGDFDIYLARPDGSAVRRVTDATAFGGQPAWSPDGARLAYVSERTGSSQIFLLDLEGGDVARLTSGPGAAAAPAWSPDGSTIAFVADRDGNLGIYAATLDGAARRLTENPGSDRHPAWSADGARLWFTSDRGGSSALYEMDASGGDAAAVLRQGATGDDTQPAPSPDGRWLAWVSVPGDDFGVLRRPLGDGDDDGQPVQVTFRSGTDGLGLSRSPDAARLAFASNRSEGYEIYTVEVFSRALATVEADDELTWDAYGRHLALVSAATGSLRLVDSTGVVLGRHEGVVGGTARWSAGGNWIAFVSTEAGVAQAHVATFDGSQRLAVHAANEAGSASPTWSASGRHLAFAGPAGPVSGLFVAALRADSLGVVSLDTVAQVSAASQDAIWPRWAPDANRLAYLVGDGVVVASVDTGAVTLVDSTKVGPVDIGDVATVTDLAWSTSGSHLYAVSGPPEGGQLTVVDRDGTVHRWPDYSLVGRPRWIGDAHLLFVSERTGDRVIYHLDLDDGTPVNLSQDPGSDTDPAYSSTLGAVVFVSERAGRGDLWAVDLDGGPAARLTGEDASLRAPHCRAPDLRRKRMWQQSPPVGRRRHMSQREQSSGTRLGATCVNSHSSAPTSGHVRISALGRPQRGCDLRARPRRRGHLAPAPRTCAPRDPHRQRLFSRLEPGALDAGPGTTAVRNHPCRGPARGPRQGGGSGFQAQ